MKDMKGIDFMHKTWITSYDISKVLHITCATTQNTRRAVTQTLFVSIAFVSICANNQSSYKRDNKHHGKDYKRCGDYPSLHL